MDYNQEIIDLAIQIQVSQCYGCNYNSSVDKDHTCKDNFYFEVALSQSTDIIRRNYNITPDSDILKDRLSLGYPFF